MSDTGYEFFEHTADVGLRATGATLEELFIHAAQGLTELLVEHSPIAITDTRPIALHASSVEELLHRWLQELLFWFATDHLVIGAYDLQSVTDTALRGQLRGERFDPARHTHGVEVKGITRHQFRVTRTPIQWEAHVIFDV